jgi:hypothetical protein
VATPYEKAVPTSFEKAVSISFKKRWFWF